MYLYVVLVLFLLNITIKQKIYYFNDTIFKYDYLTCGLSNRDLKITAKNNIIV